MIKRVFAIILIVIGVIGAGFSVAMLISAIRELEWGRVLLYCVTLAVCVELVVLNFLSFKSGNNQD